MRERKGEGARKEEEAREEEKKREERTREGGRRKPGEGRGHREGSKRRAKEASPEAASMFAAEADSPKHCDVACALCPC